MKAAESAGLSGYDAAEQIKGSKHRMYSIEMQDPVAPSVPPHEPCSGASPGCAMSSLMEAMPSTRSRMPALAPKA